MPSRIGIGYLGRGADQSLLNAGMMASKWVNNAVPPGLPAGFTAVWRWVENPDNINSEFGNNPESVAQAWVSRQQPHFFDIPKETRIEGPNENNCENAVQAAWLSRFEIERMRLMAALGYLSCIFNFGTGRPSLPVHDPLGVEIWTALLPALRIAKSSGSIMGMHAYGYNPMDPFGMLRYRGVYSWLPEDARCNLFIGEFGLDGAQGRFRDSSWRSQFPNPDAEYMNVIRAYDREIRKDQFVKGFAIFTSGTNSSSAWEPFDISGQPVVGMIENEIRSQIGVVDPVASLPPSPVPIPPPTPPPPITTFPAGTVVSVTAAALNYRTTAAVKPDNIIVSLPRLTRLTVVSGPHTSDRRDWHRLDLTALTNLAAPLHILGYAAGEFLAAVPVVPVVPPVTPPTQPPALVYSNDWTHGQAAIPDHDNIRVPLDADGSRFEIEYLDGTNEPILPDSDPSSWASIWLAPESTMRSGDTNLYPFTERLPDDELALYLAPDAPIVEHWFKRYGKQWWELTKTVDLPAAAYRFTVEVYPDIYSGNHEWAPDPISGEVRCIFIGHEGVPYTIGGFGQWRKQGRSINHPGGPLQHGIEFRARYGVETVGLFIRRWKVERL